MVRNLVVKVTCGQDDPERANQGLTVAATAALAGARVSLWLTGEATWFAVVGRVPSLGLPDAASAGQLVDDVVAMGAVTVCTQCAKRRSIELEELLPGARIAGAASFVEEILADGVQAVVY